MCDNDQPLVQEEAEALARYPWLSALQERGACPASPAGPLLTEPSRSSAKIVLPLILGGRNLSIPLTRRRCRDEVPTDRTVCYLDQGGGKLIVAVYRNGRWLNRSGRPLDIEPKYWLEIGARD